MLTIPANSFPGDSGCSSQASCDDLRDVHRDFRQGIRLIIYALPFLMELRQLLCHCHHHRNHDQDHHHCGHQHHHHHAGVQERDDRRHEGRVVMAIIIVIFTIIAMIIITLKIITVKLVFRNEKIGDTKNHHHCLHRLFLLQNKCQLVSFLKKTYIMMICSNQVFSY